MPLRLITDPVGATWHVWHVMPDARIGRAGVGVSPALAAGWLAFERADALPDALPDVPGEKRRLVPVPADWDTAPNDALLTLLAAAVPVRRRPHA